VKGIPQIIVNIQLRSSHDVYYTLYLPFPVVFNAQSRQLKEVADYYIAKRGILASNICGVKPESPDGPGTELIDVAAFDRLIRKPIQRCLTAVGKDQILCIVLAYDISYKENARAGLGMAVDQYIADVWDVLPSSGRVLNPYFAHAQAKAGLYPRFIALENYRARPEAKIIYSIWRLDGASPALAKGLVDKALVAEDQRATGQACFDRRFGDLAAIEDKGYGSGPRRTE
jgi:uncharacterized protein (TIGR03790 family)